MFIDFRERGKDRGREGVTERGGEREKHRCGRSIDGLLPVQISTISRTRNLGMCPDQCLNLHPFQCMGQCFNVNMFSAICCGILGM